MCSHRVSVAIASGKHPVSIPNLEVKPASADGTATGRSWESRTPPDIHTVKGHPNPGWPLTFVTASSHAGQSEAGVFHCRLPVVGQLSVGDGGQAAADPLLCGSSCGRGCCHGDQNGIHYDIDAPLCKYGELHHGKCYHEQYRCIRKNVTFR